MCEATIGLIIDVGHSDLYFRVASLCFIKVQFCLSPCFFLCTQIFFFYLQSAHCPATALIVILDCCCRVMPLFRLLRCNLVNKIQELGS